MRGVIFFLWCTCLVTVLANSNQCGVNEMYTECRSACEPSCEERIVFCNDACAPAGCQCMSGYLRDWKGKCIKPEECPKCGDNAFFSCGSACDITCDTLGEPCRIINIKCNEMCYCNHGFARDDTGKCIPATECPIQKCNKDTNALYSLNKWTPCPATCDNIHAKTGENCANALAFGCICKEGYIVHKSGKCVRPEQCTVKV